MSRTYKFFEPNWYNGEPPSGSYREIFKWGDSQTTEVLDEYLFILLKEKYGLTNEDFTRQKLGLEQIEDVEPTPLSQEKQKKLRSVFGKENVSFSAYDRIRAGYTKSVSDINELRVNLADKLPLAVILVKSEKHISDALTFCAENKLGLSVYGGGTGTVGSVSSEGRIVLDMRGFNKVLKFNESDQIITVQPGITGIALEKVLEEAPENFDVNKRYTTGFKPGSYEMSTVGGWISARAVSENVGYYGRIEDIVVSMRIVTEKGIIDTSSLNGQARGLDIGGLFFGSEGRYGIISEVSLKIFRARPETNSKVCFIFKTWQSAQQAARDIMQAQQSGPFYMRLSDEDETAFLMDSKGTKNNLYNLLFTLKSIKKGRACMLTAFTGGSMRESVAVKKAVKRHSRRHGGKNFYSYSANYFMRGSLDDPYLRETLQDFGFAADFSECFVPYSLIPAVHQKVREYCKTVEDVISMSHLTHFRSFGAGLKVVYISQINRGRTMKSFKEGLWDAMLSAGALPFSRGIGKENKKRFADFIDPIFLETDKLIKDYFDPSGVLNNNSDETFLKKVPSKTYNKNGSPS